MKATTCDQCEAVIPKNTGFYVQNALRLSSAGVSSASEPNTLDLCSWRCMEEYARGRAK